jgi:hypothetical protein
MSFSLEKCLTFDGKRDAHTTTNTQRSHTFLGITALHFVQQGDQDTAA